MDCRVVTLSFQHRRKMLRVSLREMCERDNVILPEKWAKLRPEQLRPAQFLELTADLYGTRAPELVPPLERNHSSVVATSREIYTSPIVWRKNMFANMNISNKQKAKLEKWSLDGSDDLLDDTEEDENNDDDDDDDEAEPAWKKERDLRKSRVK